MGRSRELTGPTDRGAFLDVALDFFVYASVPFGFGLADPPANALAACALLLGFMGTATSFLAFAIVAERRGLTSLAFPDKGITISEESPRVRKRSLFSSPCAFFRFGFLCWPGSSLFCASLRQRPAGPGDGEHLLSRRKSDRARRKSDRDAFRRRWPNRLFSAACTRLVRNGYNGLHLDRQQGLAGRGFDPSCPPIVEPSFDRRFDHFEKWRNVEIAWHE